MTKIPIYFMPGLAAGPEIFEHISLPEDSYEFHYLKWKKPLTLEESISNYAMRMCEDVKRDNPVLIGVSFGGIMVQEMGKFLTTKKIIIISSIKSKEELPKKFKLANFTKAYKLFPAKLIANFEDYTKYFIGKSLQKRAEIYKKYLSVRSGPYLHWSVYNVVNWQQVESQIGLVHIHGTKDKVFPIKNIKNTIEIEGGTHSMILIKAKIISKHIHESLTC